MARCRSTSFVVSRVKRAWWKLTKAIHALGLVSTQAQQDVDLASEPHFMARWPSCVGCSTVGSESYHKDDTKSKVLRRKKPPAVMRPLQAFDTFD
jgi:hypothetical protein